MTHRRTMWLALKRAQGCAGGKHGFAAKHVDDLRVSYSHPQITMCNYSTNTTDVSTYILYMYIYIYVYIYMCRCNVYVYTSDLQISLGWDLFRKIFPANSNCPTFFCLFEVLVGIHPMKLMAGCKNQREPNPDTMKSNLSARITRKKTKKGKRKKR